MENANGTETCGGGIRGVAMAIDSVVWLASFFVAVFAVAAATGQLETGTNGLDANLTGTPGTIAFGLWLGLGIGYHTLLEWRFGKTIGKYLVGIRVAKDDGSLPSLSSSLVRNVFRLVDFLPLFYVVGIVALLLSNENRRLGDRFATTAVVRS